MKIAIYHNNLEHTLQIKKQLLTLLKPTDIIIDNDNPDIVISIGGDGTLIGAFHHYIDKLNKVAFTGLHTGHLGFYTDWQTSDLDALVYALMYKQPEFVKYPLLSIEVTYADKTTDSFLAINEATVRKNNGKTQEADIYINEQFLEKFRGDGLCISTPSGSTAYNKSIGGAIIEPDISAMQMAEIASLNNNVYRTLTAPIILPDTKTLNVVLKNGTNTTLTIDQIVITKPIESLHFTIAKEKIAFANYHPKENFWSTVKRSFIGDVDN